MSERKIGACLAAPSHEKKTFHFEVSFVPSHRGTLMVYTDFTHDERECGTIRNKRDVTELMKTQLSYLRLKLSLTQLINLTRIFNATELAYRPYYIAIESKKYA